MNVFVVFNPEGAAEQISELRPLLETRGVSARFSETTESEPGYAQARAAVDGGADLVVAVGGDGTVRAVAQGVAGSMVPMAVIPAGTGNLLARNLGIPIDVADALSVALDGHRRTLDAGRVGGELFTVMSGAGLDAVIMRDTTSESKDRLGSLAYVIEGAKHVFDEPIQANIRDADDRRENGSFATILVGNLGRLQGGVDLFPESSPRDGLLDLIGLRSDGGAETLAAGVSAATESMTSQRLLRMTSTEFTIEFQNPTAYELDGEPRENTARLTYEVMPESLIVMTQEQTS